MKEQLTIAAMAIASVAASAQTNNVPNRILVQSGFDVTGFALNNVDSIFFDRIDGDIKAEIGFKGYEKVDGEDVITLSVTRTPACNTFSIDVLPANTAKAYNDATMASYFKSTNSQQFYQDFTEAKLTGFKELKPNTKYTVVTLGYDKYSIPGETSRSEFTTPKAETVGTPAVTWTVDETTGTTFTLTVTPNQDTKEFYWCMFEKGGAESQFEQFGPMMGLDNMEEMIKRFSYYSYTQATTNTWDGLQPKTEYEVYVLPVDVNGNYGEMQIIPVTTAKMGGDGVAMMTITPGDIQVYETGSYFVNVTYTPNDQTSVHHDLLMEKDYYDATFTDESMADMMKADTNPWNPWDNYWNYIGVDEAPWNCEPNKTYYAFSIAKNGNDEYGPLAKVEFTTGTPTSAPAVKKVTYINGTSTRIAGKSVASKTAVVPAFKYNGGIKLDTMK